MVVSVFVGMESCVGRRFESRPVSVFVVDVKWFLLLLKTYQFVGAN